MLTTGWSRLRDWAAAHPVVLTGVVLIMAQLGFRGWLLSRAWFQQDDFVFMQRSLTSDLDLDFLFTGHVGHFMPAGFLLTWVNNRIDPLLFALPAGELLVMQAAASIACLTVLIHMFGARWGIIPPLVVFLVSPITLPAFAWWAAGINQMPLLIAFFAALHTHVSYLRHRRIRHAALTMLWTVSALLFTEKALLLFEVYAIVALAYFASGHFADRVKTIWWDYRPGVILYSGVVVAFLPFYYFTYINFEASEVAENPLGSLAFNMAGKAFASGIVGGPVEWLSANVFSALAAPSDLLLVIAWSAIGGVVFALARTRVRSKRAWLLVLAVLGSDILLVATGRAFAVGAVIGLEYRYQTEVVAATAVALALASMPLIGAKESAEVRVEHPVLDSRPFWAGALALMVGISTLTSVRFAADDLRPQSPETYYDNFAGSLPLDGRTVPMADLAVPARIWPAFSFPSNLYSNMFMPYAEHLEFTESAQDQLHMVDDAGHIRAVVIDVVRRHAEKPESVGGCVARVRNGMKRVSLDGPVVGFGWWMRLSYLARRPSRMTVRVGERDYEVEVRPGPHAVYLMADGGYDEIRVTGSGGADVCIDGVVVGTPQPVPSS